MSKAQINNDSHSLQDRKARIMLTGLGLGAALGLISSYLYARAAEENGNSDAGKVESVSTGQLLAVMLAVLGLVRQIAELGKPKKSDKANKK